MRKTPLKHKKLFVTLISAVILITSTNANHIINESIKNTNHKIKYLGSDVNGLIKEFRKQYIIVPVEEEIKSIKPNKKIKESNIFKVSAYDLSYQSTQKSRGNKEYGLTSTGYSLRGHTLASARSIAVDPNIIPINSKVRLTFLDAKYKKYNGIYIGRDQGEGIKNYHVDLFIGDYIGSNKNARDFGVTQCNIEIIKED